MVIVGIIIDKVPIFLSPVPIKYGYRAIVVEDRPNIESERYGQQAPVHQRQVLMIDAVDAGRNITDNGFDIIVKGIQRIDNFTVPNPLSNVDIQPIYFAGEVLRCRLMQGVCYYLAQTSPFDHHYLFAHRDFSFLVGVDDQPDKSARDDEDSRDIEEVIRDDVAFRQRQGELEISFLKG
ncbi:hypothetical protein D3C80_1210920 [compost metagenome]